MWLNERHHKKLQKGIQTARKIRDPIHLIFKKYRGKLQLCCRLRKSWQIAFFQYWIRKADATKTVCKNFGHVRVSNFSICSCREPVFCQWDAVHSVDTETQNNVKFSSRRRRRYDTDLPSFERLVASPSAVWTKLNVVLSVIKTAPVGCKPLHYSRRKFHLYMKHRRWFSIIIIIIRVSCASDVE